jgi:hypothetical protein
VLDGTGRVVEKYYKTALTDRQHDAFVSQALSNLLKLSIPDKYAKGLLEPLVLNGVAPQASILLICSQISIRRRAYSDGPSFRALAMQLCLSSDDEWRTWLGNESTQLAFVEKLADFGPKIPTDNLYDCLSSVWKKCAASIAKDDSRLAGSFLSSVHRLLASTAVPPKSTQIVRRLTYELIFTDIEKLSLDALLKPNNGASIVKAYASCLKEVPHSNLDAVHFFRLSTEKSKVDVPRVLVILELIAQRYFDFDHRHGLELTNVSSWLSRNILASSDPHMNYRQVACSFGSVMAHDAKCSTRLTDILDVLLLTDGSNCQFVLEWLAVAAAFMCSGRDHKGDLSFAFLCTLEPSYIQGLCASDLDRVFAILMDELPANLGAVASQKGISAEISNYLHRIHKLWVDIGTDKRWLDCVQSAMLACCKGNTSARTDGLATVATSILEAVA